MIRSMTAYARQQITAEMGELTWELRSVNSRYLEANLRLPEDLRAIEPAVRERLNKRLGRGKLEVGLRYRLDQANTAPLQVNEALVKQLLGASEQMMHHLHSSPLPTVMQVLQWPGVIQTAETDFTPMQQAAVAGLDQAIDQFIEAREREGQRLAELIAQRVSAMREQVGKARVRMPVVIEALRGRLRARLEEVMENLDNDRLEQEMALLAQKLDIDEEMDRLSTHLDEVERVLGQDEPVGRRLDFLMQELNREANTLGSKSADTETTAISVDMKVLIEQMREQIQNLE